MLKFFLQNSKVCETRCKETKNQEYRNCDILVVGSMATYALILVDTSE